MRKEQRYDESSDVWRVVMSSSKEFLLLSSSIFFSLGGGVSIVSTPVNSVSNSNGTVICFLFF